MERFDINTQTILVGHSTGAGFFIKYLSIHPDLRVDKMVLVAPWLDPEKKLKTNFFTDFTIDHDLASRTNGISVIFSDNDMASVLTTVKIIRQNIRNVSFKEFHNYGHFCYEDMKTSEFPELLQEILG